MKKIWQFVLVGIIVAIGGLFVSDLTGDFFNGMDYGSAAVLGIGMYLCVVIVTCTGVIISKLDSSPRTPTISKQIKTTFSLSGQR